MKPVFKFLPIIVFLVVSFSACKKYSEQTFVFTPSAPPYIAINDTTSQELAQGDTLSFDVVVRTALQQPVTVTYTIKGGFSLSGTYTLARNTVLGTIQVPIPAGTVPIGLTSVSGTLNLTTATTTSGLITVGRMSPASETFTVTVNQ